jgi:hypothetical protein
METLKFNFINSGSRWSFYHDCIDFADDKEIQAQIATFDQAYEWCEQQFGIDSTRWYAFSWSIFIREEADAFAFRLRWC